MRPDAPGPAEPILALDVGQTSLRCALVTADGKVTRREAVLTPSGPELATTVRELASAVRDGRAVSHAVVGVAGRVDYAAGALGWGRGEVAGWRETFSEERLGSLLGTATSLANDADLATVGEARFGAGTGHQDLVFLTISTGVGAGALLGGRLLRGRSKLCEVGLTLIGLPSDATAEPVILEDVASGRGLEAAAARAGVEVTASELVARVRDGDPVASSLWRTSSAGVATAAVNLAHLLLPTVIVIGGGVSQAGELLLRPVREWLSRYGPRDLASPIEVRLAELGDDAGLVGAAGWRDAVAAGAAR
jgi:glucokinase